MRCCFSQFLSRRTFAQRHSYDHSQSAVGLGTMLHAHQRASLRPLPINGDDIEQSISLQSSHRGQNVEIAIEIGGQPKTVRIEIPDNVFQGQRLRCNGVGMPGQNGGLNGDLIVVVTELEQSVPPPPLRGTDIRREHEVAPDTALERHMWLGTRRVDFSVPRDFVEGQILHLVGEGGLGMNGGKNGDLFVVLRKAPLEAKVATTLPLPTPLHPAPQKYGVSDTSKMVLSIVGIGVLGIGLIAFIAMVFNISFWRAALGAAVIIGVLTKAAGERHLKFWPQVISGLAIFAIIVVAVFLVLLLAGVL